MILNMNGGGASLNFKVVGGTSEPANPKENTIWVNTDMEITSWIFSATQPESPAAGMVWITTGVRSSVAFNVLESNSITVYPLSVKQYISGGWVSKTAKSYRNGEWAEWILYLLPTERPYTVYTTAPNYYYVDGDEIIYGNSSTASTNKFSFTFDDPYDVTNYSTLKATVEITEYNTSANWIYTAMAITETKIETTYNRDTPPADTISMTVFPKATGTHEVEIDLSHVSGEVYIAFIGGVLVGRVSNIRLE